jgi:hypothetical protein
MARRERHLGEHRGRQLGDGGPALVEGRENEVVGEAE